VAFYFSLVSFLEKMTYMKIQYNSRFVNNLQKQKSPTFIELFCRKAFVVAMPVNYIGIRFLRRIQNIFCRSRWHTDVSRFSALYTPHKRDGIPDDPLF